MAAIAAALAAASLAIETDTNTFRGAPLEVFLRMAFVPVGDVVNGRLLGLGRLLMLGGIALLIASASIRKRRNEVARRNRNTGDPRLRKPRA